MPMSTEKYAHTINKQYCEYFGVDEIKFIEITDLQYGDVIVKEEIIVYCFGLFKDIRNVKFYDFKVHWTIENKAFNVQLSPIIEKYYEGRSKRYRLDESAMNAAVLKCVKESYKRV